jgi:hypothetical protein
MTVAQNNVTELNFESKKNYPDAFNEIEVRALFTAPDGSERNIPAFWAGGNTWKIRYSSGLTGTHKYTTSCSDSGNRQLDGVSGEVNVAAYEGCNPLYKHGAVCRKNGDLYLKHSDGTPFYWLADTWWMGFTERLTWADGFAKLTRDRVDKGFNVVQIVAGLYPDMEPFDDRGRNEAGFPWEPGYKAVNPAYFDAADKKIAYLVEKGITPCVVGSWGYFMKAAGKENIMRHWRNLIARWAAYPVVWCVCGEANMTFYDDNSTPIEEHLKNSRRDWNDVTRFIRGYDPFRRLVTIHPTQNGHEQIEDETLLDLDMLQTGHGGVMSLVPTMKQVKLAVERKKLPVINSEVCYEGICGSSYDDVQRYLFWSNFMLGTCGHTYGANGIWQVNTKEKPYGHSPHGASWGNRPLEDAAVLPGSFQIGIAKKFITRFEWWRFEPHQEWIERPCTYDAINGSFCAGIPGEVRVIFEPWFGGNFWGNHRIYGIEKDVTYRAMYFNPITGEETDLGTVKPDGDGTWVSPRVNAFQDWVIALIKI